MPMVGGARPPDLDHLQWLTRACGASFDGKSFLDLGCGSGWLCASLAERGATHVVGIDVKEPDVAHGANWRFQRVDLEGSRWPADVLKPESGRFDFILAFDVLEHLTSPARFLGACHELLRDTGHLVLATPNTNSWERHLKGARWSGATDPQHLTLFNRYSLQFLLERTGFRPTTLTAPVRKLGPLATIAPQIGAQIFCVATPIETPS